MSENSSIFLYNIGMQNSVKNVHWFPGHMKKASIKIEEQVKLVDFVIVVLDSRIPVSSKSDLLEKIVENKKKLYVLTKIDLSDETITKSWLDKLNNDGNIAISLDLKNNNSKKLLLDAVEKFSIIKKEKYLKKGIKNVDIKAMVVGIPNVGKSTLINLFAEKKITQTGNTPGVTKNVRWVKVNNFQLLDVPGILQPSFENKIKANNLALVGSMREEILPIHDLCFQALDFLKSKYKDALKSRYNLENENKENNDLIEEIAKKRGLLSKGNVADIEKTESLVLSEFRNGLICKFSLEEPEC